jgi:hypothetical protein
MKSIDLWLVGFGLRCGALLVGEVACFLFVVPTLFNLHSDLADAGAALLAIVALAGGLLSTLALAREFNHLLRSGENE